MKRTIRLESANVETADTRNKRIDAISKSGNKKKDNERDNRVVIPAGFLKSGK